MSKEPVPFHTAALQKRDQCVPLCDNVCDSGAHGEISVDDVAHRNGSVALWQTNERGSCAMARERRYEPDCAART